MAFDYEASRATATRLIEAFGKGATLRQPGARTGPEWDSAPGTPIDVEIEVVDLNIAEKDRGASLAITTSRELLIAAKDGVRPAKADKVVIDGTEHEIEESWPFAPGPVTVFYQARLKS